MFAFALLPGIGPHDPRVGADPRSAPWSAVARVNIPGVSRCTAVFVAAHWAATAAHCLGQRMLGHAAPASAIHVLLGYADGAYTRHLQPDAVHVDPDAAEGPGRHWGSEVALLHFTEAVDDVLPPMAGPVAAGTALALAGYGQDRAERLLVDRACTAQPTAADDDGRPVLVHDCNGTWGTSGGAVVAWATGRWWLAGVQVAARSDGPGGLAAPASAVTRLLDPLR